MPKGPNGERRPADLIGSAIKVARIAVSDEESDAGEDDGKNANAKAMGVKGGETRARNLTAEQRSKIA